MSTHVASTALDIRSHRIADLPPLASGQISLPSQSSRPFANNSVSASRPSLPSPTSSFIGVSRSRRVGINNTTTTGNQIIRITCGQIFQALNGASDSLNGETLRQLCAEILAFSEDAIKVKIAANLSQENDTNIPSSPVQPSSRTEMQRVPSIRSLKEAINHRLAEVVENEINPSPRQDNSNIDEPRLFPTNNVLDLFGKLPNDEGQYDVFLNICDPDLMADRQVIGQNYLAFKRSDSNVPFMMFFFLCGAFFMGTGYVWSTNMHTYRQYPTAILSIIFGIFASLCLLWVTLNRVVLLSYHYNIVSLQRFHKTVEKLSNSPYGRWPDNGAILFVVLSTGFYLVNIVLMDLCDPDMVVNNGLNNHVACSSSVEPPPESYLLSMVSIIVLQIVARGVSRTAVMCSWIICVVAVNTSIYLSDSGSYGWMNLLLFFILCISYELERQPLRQFIKTTKAIVAGEMAAELRLQLAVNRTLQASQALESKRSLVRHIGHEIRTPLNVVGVGVDMLIKDLEPHASVLPDGIMETVYGIQDASNASLEVINELLEFEKLAAGLMTLECVPTPIVPFLEQAMKHHLLPARAKNISFELVPSSLVSPSLTIIVDPMKLATVFRNLFSNAIKFTKKEGRVTVRVEVKRPSLDGIEVVEVTVQDTGAGLSAANLGRLFGEGVQFNANGLQGGGGSGLGLFNTKGIVELHENGKIWAESGGEGKGSTFFVHLPLHSRLYVAPQYGSVLDMNRSSFRFLLSENADEKQPESTAHERSLILAVQDPAALVVVEAWKPIILVVDDSAMNRKMLVRMLISKGFACCEAEDGVEALSEMSRKMISENLSIKQAPPDGNDTLLRRVGSNDRKGVYNKSIALSFDMHCQHRQFSIDAVLIDFHMPRMNGPDAIVEMRKIGFRGPIIGVSGGDEKTMQQFLQAGASNVIQKPAQSGKLVDMLLAGFRLVVREETSRKPATMDDVGRAEDTPHEGITRMRQFLDERVAVKK